MRRGFGARRRRRPCPGAHTEKFCSARPGGILRFETARYLQKERYERRCGTPCRTAAPRAARPRRRPRALRRGTRRGGGRDLLRHGLLQRPPQGGELHRRDLLRRMPRRPSRRGARLRDGERRHQGHRDGRRPRADAPVRAARRRRLHRPGLGPVLRGAPPHARARAPRVHAGERPRPARRPVVPRSRRRPRDPLPRALRPRDRPYRAGGHRPRGLRPRLHLLLLFGAVPAVELRLLRPLGQPRHVRPALPPALQAARRRRLPHPARGPRPRALPARQLHRRHAARAPRGRGRGAQARGAHEGARLRALRGGAPTARRSTTRCPAQRAGNRASAPRSRAPPASAASTATSRAPTGTGPRATR